MQLGRTLTLAGVSECLLTIWRLVGGFPVIWKRDLSAKGHQKSMLSVGYKTFSILLFLVFIPIYVSIANQVVDEFIKTDCKKSCVVQISTFIGNCFWIFTTISLKVNKLLRFKLLKTHLQYVLKSKFRKIPAANNFLAYIILVTGYFVAMQMWISFVLLGSEMGILLSVYTVVIDSGPQFTFHLISLSLYSFVHYLSETTEHLTIRLRKSYTSQRNAPSGGSDGVIFTNKEQPTKKTSSAGTTKLKDTSLHSISESTSRLIKLLKNVKEELAEIRVVFVSLRKYFEFPVLLMISLAVLQNIAMLLRLGRLNEGGESSEKYYILYLVSQLFQMFGILNSQHRYENSVSKSV